MPSDIALIGYMSGRCCLMATNLLSRSCKSRILLRLIGYCISCSARIFRFFLMMSVSSLLQQDKRGGSSLQWKTPSSSSLGISKFVKSIKVPLSEIFPPEAFSIMGSLKKQSVSTFFFPLMYLNVTSKSSRYILHRRRRWHGSVLKVRFLWLVYGAHGAV